MQSDFDHGVDLSQVKCVVALDPRPVSCDAVSSTIVYISYIPKVHNVSISYNAVHHSKII
jgi:hypothetical protein